MISSGDKIAHYEIVRLLGKGGMGEVYLAKDTKLDRKVALKFLPKEMAHDPTMKDRFLREAKSAASLDHPFICKIYEAGESDGIAYIAMEYVEGDTLKEKLDKEPLELKDSLRVILEIAEALEKAHNSGIVHRDLKPANIMITPQGHTKVMDFGLAKRILPTEEQELSHTITQASLTEQGAIAGTIAYMSPEQARGEDIDTRSDIFSVGIIFYQMVSGSHPFSKTSPIETLTSILRDPHPPTQIKPKSVNPVLNPVLRKALAKDIDERYLKIADFAADIRKIQKDIFGGGRLLQRALPIIAASIIVVVLLVVVLLRFTGLRGASEPEKMPDPVSVLVADFKNNTGDSLFDGSLEYAMGIGLEGAPFINNFKRDNARRAVDQLDPSAEGRLDAETAQLVCIREGINMFMDGAIEPKGDGFVLKIWARDPTKPEKATEYSKTIPTKADVLTVAASLANEIISDLGGTPAESAETMAGETFTTSSIEAMKAYTNAQEFQITGRNDEAIQEFLRAINLDPNFGRAYSGLGLMYHNRGQFEEGEKYLNQALTNIDHMCEREKFRIMAIYYLRNRNYPKAIEELTELLEKYPADYAGRTNLALAYFYARDFTKAKDMGRQAVEIYPKNSLSRFNLSWYAIADGDLALAEQQAQTAIDNSPGYEKAYVSLVLSKFMQAKSEEAVSIYQTLERVSPVGESLTALGMADIALYEGRLTDAIAILEQRLATDKKEGRKDYAGNKWSLLSHAYLLQRRNNKAVEAAEQAIAAESKEIGTLFCTAQVYIQSGRAEKARTIAANLSSLRSPEPRAYAKIIEGEILKKAGQPQGAIELFNEAQDIISTWLGRFSLGKVLIDIDAFPDAHDELDYCLDHQGEAASVFFNDVPSLHYLPLVYYYIGRAQEGLGSTATKDSYQKFLQIKANADQGDPLVEDCLRRLAQLK